MNTSEETIVAIEVGCKVDTSKLIKKENFTGNKNYFGHTENGIPVYLNEKLGEKETKNIMEKKFKELAVGNYIAFVKQVYDKVNQNDPTKKYIVVELDVKGEEDLQYLNFFLEGYSDKALEISQDQIKKLLNEFNIDALQELTGREIQLNVKLSKSGYLNRFIYPKRKTMEWGNNFSADCKLVKIFETKDGNKFNCIVEIPFNNEVYEEFVLFRKDNEYDVQNFDTLLSRAKLSLDTCLGQPLDIKCTFKVSKSPSKKDPDIIFTNKKLFIPSNNTGPRTSHWTK